MRNSKKGVTLVETVLAVVVLSMFAIGVLSLLTSGRTMITKTTEKSEAYAIATQKMDLLISTISNTSLETEEGAEDSFFNITPDVALGDLLSLKEEKVAEITGIAKENISIDVATYDGTDVNTLENVRGWYISFPYEGVTVSGFASYTQGVFDLK